MSLANLNNSMVNIKFNNGNVYGKLTDCGDHKYRLEGRHFCLSFFDDVVDKVTKPDESLWSNLWFRVCCYIIMFPFLVFAMQFIVGFIIGFIDGFARGYVKTAYPNGL